MNITVGLSSLSAAFLSEAWTSASAEVVIAATVLAGSAVALRELSRVIRRRPAFDPFTEYRVARSLAQGRTMT